MKLSLIDILSDLGLNQVGQNEISCKKTKADFKDILALFLTQFFANVKVEKFESICLPQEGSSSVQLYPTFISKPKSLESQVSNTQTEKQLDISVSNQESKEVKTSLIPALDAFFFAEDGEVLELFQNLNLKDKISLKQEIHKFIIDEGFEEVGLDESIREFVFAKRVDYESVKGNGIETILPEDLQDERVLKKGEKVGSKLEPSPREIALGNDVKVFESGVGEVLKKDNEIDIEELIFKSRKLKPQFENRGCNVDIKNEKEDVVSTSFERNQAKSEFDLQHEFKKFEISNVKFGRVYEKVGNWNLSFINAIDSSDEAGAGNFVLSVKAKEILDVIKTLVFKNGDFIYDKVILKVEPGEIGEVVVKISQGEKGVRILFEVKNFEAKHLIESGFYNLKASLESSNVMPEKISVLMVGENINNNYFDSSSSDHGQFLKKANKKKNFDSFESVRIYGGSLIEAII